MISQLAPYAPGIMGLLFAAVAFLSVRHIAANRAVFVPPAPPSEQAEEAQDVLPFDELKTTDELRAELRRQREQFEHS